MLPEIQLPHVSNVSANEFGALRSGVVDTFLNNAAAWTESQAKSAVKFLGP